MSDFDDLTDSRLADEIYGNVALVRKRGDLTGTEEDSLNMALAGVEEQRRRLSGTANE